MTISTQTAEDTVAALRILTETKERFALIKPHARDYHNAASYQAARKIAIARSTVIDELIEELEEDLAVIGLLES
jgi:hypothetical protein